MHRVRHGVEILLLGFVGLDETGAGPDARILVVRQLYQNQDFFQILDTRRSYY